jgi:type I restriction enzyme S subunit
MEDLGIGQKTSVPTQVKPLAEVVGSYTYFADGDVLLAKITPCFENGKIGIAAGLSNGIGFGSSEYIVFRPSQSIDKDWLYYFLSRESFRKEGAERMSGAVGHKRVAKEFIEAYPIPLPPVPEQKRIVAILDEAFEGISAAVANAEKNLANARELFDGYLNSVFTQKGEGWVESPLESIAGILNGYAFKSTDFSSNPGAKCIKITNVGVREFVSDSDNFLPAGFTKKYATVTVPEGSIVFALTRTLIAGGLKVAIVPDAYDQALLNQRVASVLPDTTKITTSFLFSYMLTQKVVDYVRERVNTLMQPNLSIKDLRCIPVPLPPISEQNRITDQLSCLREEIQELEAIYRQKLADLAELKQAVLQKAFAGELTAQPERFLQEAVA